MWGEIRENPAALVYAVLVHLAPHIADSHMRLVRLYIDRMHGGGVAR